MESDVDSFLRLHVAAAKDEETSLGGEGIGPMLTEAGRALIPNGQFA